MTELFYFAAGVGLTVASYQGWLTWVYDKAKPVVFGWFKKDAPK